MVGGSAGGHWSWGDEAGTVYLTGSHTWNTLQDTGPTEPPPAFDFDACLDLLVKHHHNFIRLWRYEATRLQGWEGGQAPIRYTAQHPWQCVGPGTALDGLPKFDFTRWNEGHFDRLRARVRAAGQRGINVSIMLFEGCCLRVQPSPAFATRCDLEGENPEPKSDAPSPINYSTDPATSSKESPTARDTAPLLIEVRAIE